MYIIQWRISRLCNLMYALGNLITKVNEILNDKIHYLDESLKNTEEADDPILWRPWYSHINCCVDPKSHTWWHLFPLPLLRALFHSVPLWERQNLDLTILMKINSVPPRFSTEAFVHFAFLLICALLSGCVMWQWSCEDCIYVYTTSWVTRGNFWKKSTLWAQKQHFLALGLRRQNAMAFVFHLAGVTPCGFQCPFDFYTVCRQDFSCLEVKKASTIVVSWFLGDCQSLLFERKAFEVLQKGCSLFTSLSEEFSRGKDNISKICKPHISLLFFGLLFLVFCCCSGIIEKSYGLYLDLLPSGRRSYIFPSDWR